WFDAGDRSLRRQPRHPTGDLRDLVDPADATDRSRSSEPSGELEPTPLAGAGPVTTRVRGPRPRWQAPAEPAGTRPSHRLQPRTPYPPSNRHPHARQL